jgi:hypothetical protein
MVRAETRACTKNAADERNGAGPAVVGGDENGRAGESNGAKND